jgi:hypothetical protein
MKMDENQESITINLKETEADINRVREDLKGMLMRHPSTQTSNLNMETGCFF